MRSYCVGDLFGSRIEFGKCKRLSRVRDLQCSEIGKLFSGSAEDLGKPTNTFLMRHVEEVVGTKGLRQQVWVFVRRLRRCFLRRPQVSPPRDKRQREEHGEENYRENWCQNQSSNTPEFVTVLAALLLTA